ncbi:MAG: SufE family protein [Alphaproteobacteria bacterium]|nr:SufE family protein [Alphaproteobacteria bacterium]
MTQEELLENFSFLTDWEDKYRYLIELGDMLEDFSESDKIPQNKVDGCMSQVWLISQKKDNKYYFRATSDAHIVRGLIFVLLVLVNEKTASEIQSVDIKTIFDQLGLADNLSPTRRNGFFAMIERIRFLSQAI